MKRSTKRTIKTILMGVLGVGLLVGAVSLVSSLVGKNDDEIAMKTIYPTFEVGGLTENGEHEESEKTIYTKKAFECQGLDIKLDFDNHIQYQVFYYESDGDFISASSVYEGNNKLDVPGQATHARIEITPLWDELGEDFEDEENQVIKWYQVSNYSNQMEIRVYQEQIAWTTLEFADILKVGCYKGTNLNTNGEAHYIDKLDIKKYDTLFISTELSDSPYDGSDVSIVFFDKDENIICVMSAVDFVANPVGEGGTATNYIVSQNFNVEDYAYVSISCLDSYLDNLVVLGK